MQEKNKRELFRIQKNILKKQGGTFRESEFSGEKLQAPENKTQIRCQSNVRQKWMCRSFQSIWTFVKNLLSPAGLKKKHF